MNNIKTIALEYLKLVLLIAACSLWSFEFWGSGDVGTLGWTKEVALWLLTTTFLFLIFTSLLGRYSRLTLLFSSAVAFSFCELNALDWVVQTYIDIVHGSSAPESYAPVKISAYSTFISIFWLVMLRNQLKSSGAIRKITFGFYSVLAIGFSVYHIYAYTSTYQRALVQENSIVQAEMERLLVSDDFKLLCDERGVYLCGEWMDGDEFPRELVNSSPNIGFIIDEYEENAWSNPYLGSFVENGFNTTTSLQEDDVVRDVHWYTYRFVKDRDLGQYRMIAYDQYHSIGTFVSAVSMIFVVALFFWLPIISFVLAKHPAEVSRDKKGTAGAVLLAICAYIPLNLVDDVVLVPLGCLLVGLIASLYVTYKRGTWLKAIGSAIYILLPFALISYYCVDASLNDFDEASLQALAFSISAAYWLSLTVLLVMLTARGVSVGAFLVCILVWGVHLRYKATSILGDVSFTGVPLLELDWLQSVVGWLGSAYVVDAIVCLIVLITAAFTRKGIVDTVVLVISFVAVAGGALTQFALGLGTEAMVARFVDDGFEAIDLNLVHEYTYYFRAAVSCAFLTFIGTALILMGNHHAKINQDQ